MQEPTSLIRTFDLDSARWIVIDREERRNAINTSVLEGIANALTEAAGRPEIRSVVLTGSGDRAFCAGADLSQGSGVFSDGAAEPTTDFGRLARQVRQFRKPLIARVNGACVAGGLALLSLCDMAVASDKARFGLPEVKVGVFPMQVAVYLRHTLNAIQINELCLTGELINATRALDLGLVNKVVPHDDLDHAVGQIVSAIELGSPDAIARGKYALAAMQAMSFEEALAFAEAQISIASSSDDAKEGISSFIEKRPARWVPSRKEQNA